MPEDHQNERPASPPGGDERTPDKVQGQIKYAERQTTKKVESRVVTDTMSVEPEKQGGKVDEQGLPADDSKFG